MSTSKLHHMMQQQSDNARKPTPLKLSVPKNSSLSSHKRRDRLIETSSIGLGTNNRNTMNTSTSTSNKMPMDSSNNNDKMLLRKVAVHMSSKLAEDRKQVEKEFSQEYMQWKKKTTLERDVLKGELQRATKTLTVLNGKVKIHIQALSENCLKEVKVKEKEQMATNAEIQANWQKSHEQLFQCFESEARAL